MNQDDFKKNIIAILNNYSGYHPAQSMICNFFRIFSGHSLSGYRRAETLRTLVNGEKKLDTLVDKVVDYYLYCFKVDDRRSRNSCLLKELSSVFIRFYNITRNDLELVSPKFPVSYGFGSDTVGYCQYDTVRGLLVILEQKKSLSGKFSHALKD